SHALPEYGGYLAHTEAMPLAGRAQVGQSALAIGAEAKVVADHDVASVEPADEQRVDESFRWQVADQAEARAEQVVDAELGEKLEAFAETREARRRIRRREELFRRRFEREHERAVAP